MIPRLRPAQPEEREFAFDVKRDAMGPHIEKKWGWDEHFQRAFHARRWTEKPWTIICVGPERVGTVSISWTRTHMQFGEFYIFTRYRGIGLGGQVLSAALREADERALDTRLEYLKWNPVASLYLRHGFRVVSENDFHYFAVRRPHAV